MRLAVAAINETPDWQLEDMPEVKAVWGFYWFDRDESTYCCEITPSFWLTPLEVYIEYHNEDSIPEERRDKVGQTIWENFHAHTDPMYVHCRDINLGGLVKDIGMPKGWDPSEEDVEEGMAGMAAVCSFWVEDNKIFIS